MAVWMLEALEPAYDVTILTWDVPDFRALDRRFGTTLAERRLPVRTPRPAAKWLIERIPDDSSLQTANYLLRCAKKQRSEFAAVVVSSSMEADVGQPAIQYLHYPYLGVKRHLFQTPGDAPLGERVRALRAGRLRPWMVISGYSFERMRANLTLTNSDWTRERIREAFDMDSHVVYPPAERPRVDIPWDERHDAFITIGWMEEIKRQDWIIETLALVHREVPDIRLHICGPKLSSAYAHRVERLAEEHRSWVRIHYDLPSDELLDLASHQRYGIHGMIGEHFGIAPATLVRCGCIPFVHDSGGQVEIVHRDPRLCYGTREEAAAKILAVMRNREAQQSLAAELKAGSDRFSAETFMRQIRDEVAAFIRQRDAETPGRRR